MRRTVQIVDRHPIFEQFVFRIEEARLRHERFDGSLSAELVRLNLDRGDSVAALVHDTQRDRLMLAEQFRFSTYDKGPGWMLELPAGVLEVGEAPEAATRRELQEEIGFAVDSLSPIATVYLSPGGCSERIHIFYVPVTPSDHTSSGGGVPSEGEDIRIVEMPVRTAFALVEAREIVDAKTVIAIQWLQLRRPTTSR
jgi:ADP-ribose pyrophosphatase